SLSFLFPLTTCFPYLISPCGWYGILFLFPFDVFPLEKTEITSCLFIGFSFALTKPTALFLIHTQSYLNHSRLLIRSLLENGSLPNNTTAPFFFITLLYCSHSGSNGITLSHLHAVVP